MDQVLIFFILTASILARIFTSENSNAIGLNEAGLSGSFASFGRIMMMDSLIDKGNTPSANALLHFFNSSGSNVSSELL